MMATYFHGNSEIQSDNLQTLYLVNPSYGAAYSDSQTPINMLLLNPASGGVQHAPSLPSQHLVGVPLGAPPGSASSGDDPSRPSLHYNLWNSTADPAAGGGSQHQIPTAVAVGSGGDVASPMGYRRPQAVAVAAHSHQTQGLSLSLNNSSPHKNVAGSTVLVSAGDGSNTSTSLVAKGVPGAGDGSAGGALFSSKYLKAAQELLDEVVNVERAMMKAGLGPEGAKGKKSRTAAVGSGEEQSGGGGDGESRDGNRAGPAELTTAVRQELQMKKEKLLIMLDEVEQRYRLYNNQMQMVASSFEQAAGPGSARSYTAVALQTISRQFRCLKDAIAAQIKATKKSLGEDYGPGGGGKGEGSMSRLRFVEQQLRQQRELHQLGMVQHNAWRPQRGLPERAVSVLRAWLFEHFLHPYPKDTDKHMLAKQTGLTRSQVSNWFINARVRLWKPMVEEMYHEEVKFQDQNASDQDHTNTTNNNNQNDNDKRKNPIVSSTRTSSSSAALHSHSHQQVEIKSSRSSLNHHAHPHQQAFSFVGSTQMEQPVTQRSPKRPRSSDVHNSPSSILSMEMEMKPGAGDASTHGGFGAYMVGQIGSRFDPDQQLGQQYHHGNGVSLTLGLPHCEGLSLSGAQQHQHNFMVPGQVMQLGPRLEVGIGDGEFCGIGTSQPSDTSASPYDGIDIGNRKRFAAQLLPDFVA